MHRRIAVALALAVTFSVSHVHADETSIPHSKTRTVVHAVGNELKRYATDAKHLATAPSHWDARQWTRFAAGVAAVGIVYTQDQRLYDAVQRNRSSTTRDFANVITPFGARRAEDISLAMILLGVARHDDTMRDAGRDSLEAEIFAGGFVTPIIKYAVGRSRPYQNEGSHSFHHFTTTHESFPSGHTTNAFAWATAVAAHYDGWVVPTIVYSIATGVGMSRIHDRAHFPSDVLAGALIGHAVARGITVRHMNNRAPRFTLTPMIVPQGFGVMVRLGK